MISRLIVLMNLIKYAERVKHKNNEDANLKIPASKSLLNLKLL